MRASDKIELFVLSALFPAQFFYVKDPFYIGALLLAFFLFREMKERKKLSLSFIDGCILIIWLYGLCSLLFSVYPTNSFNYFKVETYCLLYYFLLRLLSKEPSKTNRILLTYSMLIGLLSVIAFAYFIWFRSAVFSIGFSELYNFRFLLEPLGVPNNEWATMQLLFMGTTLLTAYLYRNNRRILTLLVCIGLLILFQIMTSFSRGIYISLFILAVGISLVLWRKLVDKRVYSIGLFFLGSAFIIFLCNKEDVITTLKMTGTVSQQRSIDGRLNTFNATKQFVKEHPLGGGSGNYLLLTDKYLNEGDQTGLTSYASNLISRILVERGIPGLLLYSILVITILFHCFRYKSKIAFLSLVILLAFAFREQTFSIFYSSLPCQVLVYTFIAIMHQRDTKQRTLDVRETKYISFTPLLVWIILFMITILRTQDAKHETAFFEAAKTGNIKLAATEIEKTGDKLPSLINRSMFYMQLYDATQDSSLLIKSESSIRQAISKNPFDVQLSYYLALIRYKRSKGQETRSALITLLNEYPNNTLWQWETFNVLYLNNEKKAASVHLATCVELSPRIMGTEIWMEHCRKDSAFIAHVKEILTEKIKTIKIAEVDPIQLAKYGKIASDLGETTLAKEYLYEALQQLPNLSIAWYNLSKIMAKENKRSQSLLFEKRGLTIELGIFIPDTFALNREKMDLFINRKKDINNLLYGRYQAKFQMWYHTKSAMSVLRTD